MQGGTACVKEVRKFYGCGMEKFGTLDNSEKTIAILGGRWWPQTATQERVRLANSFHVTY